MPIRELADGQPHAASQPAGGVDDKHRGLGSSDSGTVGPVSFETNPRVGIIGVGNIGSRVARRIAQAGMSIVGYDSDRSRPERAGIHVSDSVCELVRAVDVVLLSLPDSSVIEPIVLGDDGVLACSRPGHVVVDLSTAAPESTISIYHRLDAGGVRFLDAGVSGGVKGADAGTLTLMVGGDLDALRRVRTVLDCFSAKVFYLGNSGAGHTAKLLNNFLNAVSLAATSEVMLAAKKSGLDLTRFTEVLNSSTGVNYATLERFPRILAGDYMEGGLSGQLMAKDLRLYLSHIANAGVPTFTAPGCLALFELANAAGHADEVSNRVIDALADLSGVAWTQHQSACDEGS